MILPQDSNDTITFGIQRELPDNILVEVGYVGKWSRHLFDGLDLNDVPWMMTLGGQSLAKAYAALWNADHSGQKAPWELATLARRTSIIWFRT